MITFKLSAEEGLCAKTPITVAFMQFSLNSRTWQKIGVLNAYFEKTKHFNWDLAHFITTKHNISFFFSIKQPLHRKSSEKKRGGKKK